MDKFKQSIEENYMLIRKDTVTFDETDIYSTYDRLENNDWVGMYKEKIVRSLEESEGFKKWLRFHKFSYGLILVLLTAASVVMFGYAVIGDIGIIYKIIMVLFAIVLVLGCRTVISNLLDSEHWRIKVCAKGVVLAKSKPTKKVQIKNGKKTNISEQKCHILVGVGEYYVEAKCSINMFYKIKKEEEVWVFNLVGDDVTFNEIKHAVKITY